MAGINTKLVQEVLDEVGTRDEVGATTRVNRVVVVVVGGSDRIEDSIVFSGV